MVPEPRSSDHPTTTSDPKPPPVRQPDPELGLLAKVIAVPLAPFVALWEGGRALVTQAFPAGARAVRRILSAGARQIAQAFRRLGSVLLVPFQAAVGAGRWIVSTVGAWGRSLGRAALTLARLVRAAASWTWTRATMPLLAVARLLGHAGQAVGRPVAALARRVGLAL